MVLLGEARIEARRERVVSGTPRTQTERALAVIWSEVLRVPLVGSDDGFLELGGDSLSAVLVLVRVAEQWSLDLSVESLFDSPSLAAFARTIDEHGGIV